MAEQPPSTPAPRHRHPVAVGARSTFTLDGREVTAAQGRVADRRGRAGRDLHPPVLLPPAHEAGRDVPDVPGRGERTPRRVPAAQLLRRGAAGLGGGHRLGQGQEGPGRGARVPPRQPPPRLPGVRQGRRVPAPGPDPGLRAGRDPVRRGEAALREAHPHLRAGAAGPGAVHPVRPVHPVRRRGGRRGPDRLHRPRRADRGQHLPRPRLHLVLLRQHRPDLPGGGPDRHAVPVHRPTLGPRPGRVDLHHLLVRVPGGRPVVVQPGDPPARDRRRPGQPELAVRQGPVRLRRRERRGPPHRAAWSARTGRWCRCPGTRRSPAVAEGCRAVGGVGRGRVDRGARRGPADQRGRLRLGQAGQGGARAPTRSTPSSATACPPRWCSACPGPPSTRPPRPTPWSPDRRPPRGAARPLPPAAVGHRRRRPRPSSSSRPRATALTRYATVVPALRPGEATDAGPGAGGSGRRPAPDGRRRRGPGPGPGAHRGGRTWSSWSAGRHWPRTAHWWPRRPRRWPRRCPGARFLPALRRGNVHRRPRHGAGPGRAARPGLPRRGAGLVRPAAWGSVPGTTGPGHRRHPGRGGRGAGRWDRVRSWCCWAPTPWATSPTGPWPRRALDGAEFVVAVASAPGPVTERGRRGPARRRAPTSGRAPPPTSRAGSPAWARSWCRPGQAWPDWMIASELAVHLGGDLGLDSVGDVWDEIERLAPAHAGHHPGRPRRRRCRRRGRRPAGGQRRHPRPPAPPRRRSTPSPPPGSSRWSARGPRPAPAWPSPRRRGTRCRSRRRPASDDGAPTRPRHPVPVRSTSTYPTWSPTDSYSLRLVASPGPLRPGCSRCAPSRRWPAWWRPRHGAGQPARPRASSGWRRGARSGSGRASRPRGPGRGGRRLPAPQGGGADFNVPLDDGDRSADADRRRRARWSTSGWRRRERPALRRAPRPGRGRPALRQRRALGGAPHRR